MCCVLVAAVALRQILSPKQLSSDILRRSVNFLKIQPNDLISNVLRFRLAPRARFASMRYCLPLRAFWAPNLSCTSVGGNTETPHRSIARMDASQKNIFARKGFFPVRVFVGRRASCGPRSCSSRAPSWGPGRPPWKVGKVRPVIPWGRPPIHLRVNCWTT